MPTIVFSAAAMLALFAILSFALPSVTFQSPTLSDNATTGSNWVFVNVTSSEDLNRSLLEWGNQSGFTNVSMDNSSLTNWYANMTDLADGIYNYTVWAENATGGWNRTERRWVTVNVNCTDIGSDGIANGIIIVSSNSSQSNCTTDGVNDDVEIGRAIANASGMAVHINAGWYNIENQVLINVNDTLIEGDGTSTILNATNLTLANLNTNIFETTIDHTKNITISSMRVTSGFTSCNLDAGWIGWRSNYLSVDDYTVKNITDDSGLSLVGMGEQTQTLNHRSMNTTIRDNVITGCSGLGSFLYHDNLNIFNNIVNGSLGNVHTGIDINRNDVNVSVHDNVVVGYYSNHAFKIHGAPNNLQIYNNIFENKQGSINHAAFIIDSGNNAHIWNNTLKNSYECFRIETLGGTTNYTIENNLAYNCKYGVLTVWSQNWKMAMNFSNNVFYNSSIDGIKIVNTTTFNLTFKNNIISNSTNYSINVVDGGTLNNFNYNLVWGGGIGNYNGSVNSTGDISLDPLFANASAGDFHLKSQAGRWNGTDWVIDAQTSPAIDAGDPSDDYSEEPSPNGDRINMGAYGGTGEASKTYSVSSPPVCQSPCTYGSGGYNWTGNTTMKNVTEDNGDHYIKIGRFADNFEDNNEAWTVTPTLDPMSLSSTQAVGAYSFKMSTGHQSEQYNYSANLSNPNAPNNVTIQVYDNGTGMDNTWYVGALSASEGYLIGVDSGGTMICPSGNTTNFCYRLPGSNMYVSSVPRLSAGWVNITFEFNGTNINGYIDSSRVFSSAETNMQAIRVGSSWYSSGVAYYDEVRVWEDKRGNVTSIVKDAGNIGGVDKVWNKIKIEGLNTTGTWFHGYWNYSTDNVNYQLQDLGNITPATQYNVSNARYGSFMVELNTNDASKTPALYNVTLYSVKSGTVLTVTSPENRTYGSQNITISGTTNGDANVTYSLNGNVNISVCNGCTSFSTWNASTVQGTNNITIYAVNSTNSTDADSTTIYFTVDSLSAPTYSNVGTDSVAAGQPTKFYAYWQANAGLSAYIFSFDNCTGAFVNETYSLTGIGNWSNITKTINSTVGCTIRYVFYANSTSNNWNNTEIQNFTTLGQSVDNNDNQFWVRTDGSDSCNGQNNMSYLQNTTSCAWQTIQKAANTLTSGQAVRVQNGTYVQNAQIDINASNISFIGDNFPTIIQSNYDNYGFYIYNKTNVSVSGFRLRNVSIGIYSDYSNSISLIGNDIEAFSSPCTRSPGRNGIIVGNSNDILISNNVINTSRGGIGITGFDYSRRNVTITNNTLDVQNHTDLCGTGPAISFGGAQSGCSSAYNPWSGSQVCGWAGENIIISYNTILAGNRGCIDPNAVRNIFIYGNYINDCNHNGIDLHGTADVLIYNNTILNMSAGDSNNILTSIDYKQSETAWASGGNITIPKNISIYNNYINNQLLGGILTIGNTINVTFYNNTVITNGKGLSYQPEIWSDYPSVVYGIRFIGNNIVGSGITIGSTSSFPASPTIPALMDRTNESNVFMDNNITASQCFLFDGGNNDTYYFINNFYNCSSIVGYSSSNAIGNAYFGYYLNLRVIDENGNPVSGANITVGSTDANYSAYSLNGIHDSNGFPTTDNTKLLTNISASYVDENGYSYILNNYTNVIVLLNQYSRISRGYNITSVSYPVAWQINISKSGYYNKSFYYTTSLDEFMSNKTDRSNAVVVILNTVSQRRTLIGGGGATWGNNIQLVNISQDKSKNIIELEQEVSNTTSWWRFDENQKMGVYDFTGKHHGSFRSLGTNINWSGGKDVYGLWLSSNTSYKVDLHHSTDFDPRNDSNVCYTMWVKPMGSWNDELMHNLIEETDGTNIYTKPLAQLTT